MEGEPGREICDVKAVHSNPCRCWKGCAIDGCWMVVRKHSLFYIRVLSVGDSRASHVAGGGAGWRCSGERWATLSQGMSAGGTSTKGVSVGLYPATCLVISYLTTHREECGAVPFSQKGRASPMDTSWASAGAMLGSTGSESSQGQVFPFSSSPLAKRGIGAESSASVGSGFPPWRQIMTRCLQHPSCLSNSPRNRGGSWLSQPTGLPYRAVSPCFMLLLYLSPLFWRSNGRNLNSISVKSWILKPHVQDHWITLHRLALEPCFSV